MLDQTPDTMQSDTDLYNLLYQFSFPCIKGALGVYKNISHK